MGASSYGWLAEHLASHGFVVLAPEHDEQMNPESDLWQGAVKRPLEIQAVYAYVDVQTRPGGALAGLVDPETVAVMGHSYGGYTALAAAGARIDSAGLATHCTEAAAANHPAAWLCDMLLPHLPEMADAGRTGHPARGAVARLGGSAGGRRRGAGWGRLFLWRSGPGGN